MSWTCISMPSHENGNENEVLHILLLYFMYREAIKKYAEKFNVVF